MGTGRKDFGEWRKIGKECVSIGSDTNALTVFTLPPKLKCDPFLKGNFPSIPGLISNLLLPHQGWDYNH